MRFFFKNWTVRVRVGNVVSTPFPLNTRVPQGSVLSPTLYTIYTAECPASAAGLNVQYADDISHVIYHTGRSKAMTNTRTSREITRVTTLESKWKIQTNLTKFKVISIATKNLRPIDCRRRAHRIPTTGNYSWTTHI